MTSNETSPGLITQNQLELTQLPGIGTIVLTRSRIDPGPRAYITRRLA